MNTIKVELNILNSLIGSKNIDEEFENLIKKYPEVLKCIPLLLAVRANEIYCQDKNGGYLFNFIDNISSTDINYEKYKYFMRGTGLFDLLENKTYFKEMYIHQITENWNINLSAISNSGKMEKRFDFVVKTPNMIYGVETNFYRSDGSKLNETARSYKTPALEAKEISGFTFVWFTDGIGWINARNNLEETFDIMPYIYNIKDLENNIINKVFI